ncbi:MAG TPA: cytochrome c oxidase assembly protein [Ktedonobacteraceae bacterium]|nr:cytochrome c oxidase assembly protein [Ktedonobacteraceae bacterium]
MQDPGLDFWLNNWHWSPSVIIGILLIVGFYLYAVGPWRKRHRPEEELPSWRPFVFVLGFAIIFLALVSPLDELGDTYLFSAHMVQHLCLTLIAPPLLLLGTPAWLLEPVFAYKPLYRIARGLTYPAVAFLLFNFDFWLWHAPPLYNATLENEGIHILEHLTFIILAVINWWPIFSPMPQESKLGRLPLGGQILYLFLSGMPVVALGAGLTFFPPLYAPYLSVPRIWGISAASDQQLGGLIMWVPGNIVYILIMSVLFIRWMQNQEAKQINEERQRDQEEAELSASDNNAGLMNG